MTIDVKVLNAFVMVVNDDHQRESKKIKSKKYYLGVAIFLCLDNIGTEGGQAVASAMNGLLNELQSQIAAHNAANPDAPSQQWALVPERLPSLYYNAPAYYVQWTDADTGEARSIAVSRTNLAEDLMAVAQAAQAVVPQYRTHYSAAQATIGRTLHMHGDGGMVLLASCVVDIEAVAGDGAWRLAA